MWEEDRGRLKNIDTEGGEREGERRKNMINAERERGRCERKGECGTI